MISSPPTMAATSVDMLSESFENPMIPLINGKTTYATIHSLHKLLNSNAVSISTKLGCGTMGHLCLTLSLTVYVTLLETQVLPPTNPRAAPIIPAGATGPKAASLCYTHNAETIMFNMFQNMDRALYQQMLGTVKENFVCDLYMPHRGYRGSSMIDLLTQL